MRRLLSFAGLLMCCVAFIGCSNTELAAEAREACAFHEGVQQITTETNIIICKDGYDTAEG